MNILDYIFYFFFYSFVGWFLESCYCSVRPKKWINRGFLRGPICPIYGTGALVIMVTLIPLRELTPNLYLNELLIFIVGMVVCDFVEYMTSFIMEKLFNARWWDYSNKKYNLHGRICLTHTFYWGTAACLFSFVIHPFIDFYLISQIKESSRNILVYIFLTVFFFDLLDTVINALGIRKISGKFTALFEDIRNYSNNISSTLGDKFDRNAEEKLAEAQASFKELSNRYEQFKEEMGTKRSKTQKRLIRTFPRIKEGFVKQDKVIQDLLNELKEKINSFIDR